MVLPGLACHALTLVCDMPPSLLCCFVFALFRGQDEEGHLAFAGVRLRQTAGSDSGKNSLVCRVRCGAVLLAVPL